MIISYGFIIATPHTVFLFNRVLINTLERMIFQTWCPMLLSENQMPTTEACSRSSAVRLCTFESFHPKRSTRMRENAVAWK